MMRSTRDSLLAADMRPPERGQAMKIDVPEVLEEVRQAVEVYELALTSNDLPGLAGLFADNEHVVRYGPRENLYGAGQIAMFRAARPSGPRPREVLAKIVTTYGQDIGVAHVEFRLSGQTALGRQTQTWVRLDGGWRIVSAHVSYLEETASGNSVNESAKEADQIGTAIQTEKKE